MWSRHVFGHDLPAMPVQYWLHACMVQEHGLAESCLTHVDSIDYISACCMWNGGLHAEVRIPPCQIKRWGALNRIRRGCQGLAPRGSNIRKLGVWAMAPQTPQKAAVTVITTTGLSSICCWQA